MYFDTNAYEQHEESHKESTTFWRKVTHSTVLDKWIIDQQKFGFRMWK